MELLDELLKKRHWCQLLQTINENIVAEYTSIKEFIIENIEIIVTKTHPTTLADIFTIVCDTKKEDTLLICARKVYEGLEVTNEELEEAKLINEINIDIINVMNNIEDSDLERRVYGYRKDGQTVFVTVRLNRLLFLYYEKNSDYDQAYFYLKKYIESGYSSYELREMVNKLATFALKSENVFFFFDLIPYIDMIDEAKLIMAYNEGDINYVVKNCKDFSTEKVYLISFLNICSQKKHVSFNEIAHSLKLSEEESLVLIFKALGKGLVKGYVDGEHKMLYINSVKPKMLKTAEIEEMKMRFMEWRAKVRLAIKEFSVE